MRSIAIVYPIIRVQHIGLVCFPGHCILPGHRCFLAYRASEIHRINLSRKINRSSFFGLCLIVFVFANGDLIFICCSSRLEPLVYRIKEKRSAILCPAIDMISEQNMGYGVSDLKRARARERYDCDDG